MQLGRNLWFTPRNFYYRKRTSDNVLETGDQYRSIAILYFGHPGSFILAVKPLLTVTALARAIDMDQVCLFLNTYFTK